MSRPQISTSVHESVHQIFLDRVKASGMTAGRYLSKLILNDALIRKHPGASQAYTDVFSPLAEPEVDDATAP